MQTALLHLPSQMHGYEVYEDPNITVILYPAQSDGVFKYPHYVLLTQMAFQLQTTDDPVSMVLVHDFSLTVKLHEVAATHPAPVVTHPV